MSTIIVPSHHRADTKPFAELADEPAKRARAVMQFAGILERSFNQDAVMHGIDFVKRHNTDTERKRRADIMGRWYRDLRNLGYGHIQTMDEIPKALRAELDGGNYEPPERKRLWAPGEQ